MDVCTYVFVYACMHVCIYACIYIYIYIHNHVGTLDELINRVIIKPGRMIVLLEPPRAFCSSLVSLDSL